MKIPPRSLVSLTWLVAAGAAVTGAPQLQQLHQVFRSDIDVVAVDVAVRSGNTPVKGLTSKDFELIDNGMLQSIDAVMIEDVPVDLTLILDASASTSTVIERFKLRARQIAGMLRPVDRVRLIVFSTDVTEVFPLQAGGSALPVGQIASRGGTSLNDALLLSLARAPVEGRRQLIVAFTDGLDTTSVVDASTLAAAAARADGVLHLVLSGYSGSLPPTARSLRAAAEATGGELHPPGAFDDAVDAFKGVFEDFRQSYVLRYTLGGVTRDGWHDVSVRVTKAGGNRYSIRARKGYFGG